MKTGTPLICAVVLCGGGGTRLGGIDKPLALWRSQPLIDRVLDRLRPQVDRLCISANRHLDEYRRRAPVVTDENWSAGQPDTHLGPLAGVLAGARWFAAAMSMQEQQRTLILICPGDSPRIPTDLVIKLAGPGADLAYVNDGAQPQPLHALVTLDSALTIAAYLSGGGRSVRGWLAQHRATAVLMPTPDAFFNVNEPHHFNADG